MTKSKLIIIKQKCMFIIINLEIYEDKNLWSSINHNATFFKEIENLFGIVYSESYNSSFE